MNASATQKLAEFLEALATASELEDRLVLEDPDPESQRVAQALNGFLDSLWLKQFQLAAKQEMLERVVEIRTKEVHEILDNVSSGFLIVLEDQTVLDNFSRSCREIFGCEDLKGKKISELMQLSETARAHFSACYGQVFEDGLPVEVSLAQVPTDFAIGGHSYRLQAAPILGSQGQVTKVFLTINDTTELKEAEAENALRLALLEIVRQKEAFREFLFETSQAFRAVRQRPTEAALRSLLHTIKGNLGCYGLHDIAALVHTLEEARELSWADAQLIEDTLKKFLRVHRELLGFEYPEAVRAPRSVEIGRLLPLLSELAGEDSARQRRATVDAFVEELKWVPAGVLLAPLSSVVERVAERLGKSVKLEVEGSPTLVDPETMGPVLSSLVHLVRNSIDHGLEAEHERSGKPPTGKIAVRCWATDQSWEVRVEDDGRGIDVDALGRAAVRSGTISQEQLYAMNEEDKLRLIFGEGISTKAEVSTISGRGVGAAAVLRSVIAAGGTVSVQSVLGQGTSFVLSVPRPFSVARRPSMVA